VSAPPFRGIQPWRNRSRLFAPEMISTRRTWIRSINDDVATALEGGM
jgi:hypothetical protein